MDKPECYGCEYLADVFGNYVECKKSAETGTHMFVDWYYWNKGSPEKCPLKNDKITVAEQVDALQQGNPCR